MRRHYFSCIFPLLFCLVLSITAFAEDSHDRTQFGHDITVNAGEDVSEVTCFGCSVRVRGHVQGDITTFGGSVVLEEQGEVGGDLTTFGGNIHLERGVKVGGGVTVFGGRVRREEDSVIGGDVSIFSGGLWLALIFGLPLVVLGAIIALIIWLVRYASRKPSTVAA